MAEVTAPWVVDMAAETSELRSTGASSISPTAGSGSSVEAVYCKTFNIGRACRKVLPAAASAVCAESSPIVNFELTETQCNEKLVQALRSAGVQLPKVDFAILENFEQVGDPGQTAIGVCPGSTVQCVPPDIGARKVEDDVGAKWKLSETAGDMQRVGEPDQAEAWRPPGLAGIGLVGYARLLGRRERGTPRSEQCIFVQVGGTRYKQCW